MTISSRDLKLLWSRAAGRCSICRTVLTHNSINGIGAYPVGEQAHIVADKVAGPRGQSNLSAQDKNTYFNLILLCPTHHREIDANEHDYTVEKLFIAKQRHEMWVLDALESADNAIVPPQVNYSEIMEFVREWLAFSQFFFLFFNQIDCFVRFKESEKFPENEIREWHDRRWKLRELLYHCCEDNLVIKEVPDWERLKRDENYIVDNGYKTPFSFMLDFGNPVRMINMHGSAIWSAYHIASEFIEILSWKYPEIKTMLERA